LPRLQEIASYRTTYNIKSEVYLGFLENDDEFTTGKNEFFNDDQADEIDQLCDRILLHSYRSDPADLEAYLKNRMISFSSNSKPTHIIPLFSVENQEPSKEKFLGEVLRSSSSTINLNTIQSGFNKTLATSTSFTGPTASATSTGDLTGAGTGAANIIDGFQWFFYGSPGLPKCSTLVFAGLDDEYCQASAVSTTGNNGLYDFFWYDMTGNIETAVGTGRDLPVNPTVQTLYKVVMKPKDPATTMNEAGCPRRDEDYIVVTPSANPSTRPTFSVTNSPQTYIHGGTEVTLTASPATGLDYSWTPNSWLNVSTGSSVKASPLNTTIYTVVGTTSGSNCSSKQSVLVNSPGAIGPGGSNAIMRVYSPNPQSCANPGTGILQVEGGEAFNATGYLWRDFSGVPLTNSGANTYRVQDLPPGDYICTVTFIDGTMVNFNGSIEAISAPIPTLITNHTPIDCAIPTLSTETSFFNYEWQLNGVNITGSNSRNFIANQNGDYSVIVTNNNGCYGISESVNVSSAFDHANGLNISSSTTFNSSKKINGHLNIYSGVHLTIDNGATIEFGNTGRINVYDGGATLTISNAVLKGLTGCEFIWQGITVHEGGTLNLGSNSVININGNGKILIAYETGILNYDQNASIILADASSSLELHGKINILNNSDFHYSGNGYIQCTGGPAINFGSGGTIGNNASSNMFFKVNGTLHLEGTSVSVSKVNFINEHQSYLSATDNNVFFNQVSMDLNGTISGNTYGFKGTNLTDFKMFNSTINRFDKGVWLESLALPGKARFNSVTFNNCETAIKANYVSSLDMTSSKVISGMIGFDFSNCNTVNAFGTSVSACNDVGIKLNDVNGFYLSGTAARVNNNSIGIDAVSSLIFLRNGAKVDQNVTGIKLFGSYSGSNQSFSSMLTIGDQGCGGVFNNQSGITGKDFILNIDALQHSINRTGNINDVYPNRFDNNSGQTFNICYTNSSNAPSEILAKGNYWGNTVLPGNNYTIKVNCLKNWPLTLNMQNPSTCIPIAICSNCNPIGNPGAGSATPIGDIKPDALLNLLSCQAPVTGERTIGLHYKEANQVFIPEDNFTSRLMFKEISDIDLEKTQSGSFRGIYEDGSKLAFSNVCEHLVHVSKVLVRGENFQTQFRKAYNNENESEYDVNNLLHAKLINNSLSIVPNPASSFVMVNFKIEDNTKDLEIRFTNLLGQTISSKVVSAGSNSTEINLNGIQEGIYFCSLIIDGKVIQTDKLVISK